jgi:uroporphyrinogen decarboxylase
MGLHYRKADAALVLFRLTTQTPGRLAHDMPSRRRWKITATMNNLKNDTLIRSLLRQPTPYTPVWLMRQAGRYLPEYNLTRKKAGSFLALAKSPALATEVTLQPLERFNLDAAILFSDILTVPDAMGLGLYFVEGEGPRFERPLRDATTVAKMTPPDPAGELRYVTDAVSEIRRALCGRVPLIGFAGSPYTLACYMVEGGASADFRIIKSMLYSEPALLHRILDLNARSVTNYLNAQIEAGAQAVMIFDTWGGSLSHAAYAEFSLAYIQRIISELRREYDGARIPSIVFTKGGGTWIEAITRTGCDAVGLDWTTDMGEARKKIGDRVALQGNLDPAVLHSPPNVIRTQVANVLNSYGAGSGHVFNLGHGIVPATRPESVQVMVDAVHELSASLHS